MICRHEGEWEDEVIVIKDLKTKLKLEVLWDHYMKMQSIVTQFGYRVEVYYGVVTEAMHHATTRNPLNKEMEALDFVITASKKTKTFFTPGKALWTEQILWQLIMQLPLLQASGNNGKYHFGFYTSFSLGQGKLAYNKLFNTDRQLNVAERYTLIMADSEHEGNGGRLLYGRKGDRD